MLAERLRVEEQDTLILCRPATPYLCLGYHQPLAAILDAKECQRRGLPVVRRRLGGGTTYLDANQLFYQCVFHHSRLPATVQDVYRLVLAAPVAVLRRLGLNAELREVNEIEVDGKRIAGTGGGRIGEACVVVGNLLFDFDFDAMVSVWRTPSPAFRRLAAKALRERVVTLRQMGVTTSFEAVAAMLIEAFAEAFGRELRPDSLTAAERELAEAMAAELTSAAFLALHRERGDSPPPLKISARAFIHADTMSLNGYRLTGSFLVAQERIQEVIFESDPPHDWRCLQERLRGIPFKQWKEQVLGQPQA
jgi:lipoate-protein ligase A